MNLRYFARAHQDKKVHFYRLIRNFLSIVENFRLQINAKAGNKVVLYYPLLNRAAGNKVFLFQLLISN